MGATGYMSPLRFPRLRLPVQATEAGGRPETLSGRNQEASHPAQGLEVSLPQMSGHVLAPRLLGDVLGVRPWPMRLGGLLLYRVAAEQRGHRGSSRRAV